MKSNPTTIARTLRAHFHYEPTPSQEIALIELAQFLSTDASDPRTPTFILSGYAGTGKTTLLTALVNTLDELKSKYILMAPTGRAAKVMGQITNRDATTIHGTIYNPNQDEKTGRVHFTLKENNNPPGTVYIIDEASMVAHPGNTMFHSSYSEDLLMDLITFAKAGKDARLIFVGDSAQLPPVQETYSPALIPNTFQGHSMHIQYAALTDVVRHKQESGILTNATHLRELIESPPPVCPAIEHHNLPDIHIITKKDLVQTIGRVYANQGVENTIVVTRTNRAANQYNQLIRSNIFKANNVIMKDERLMVCRNSTRWASSIPNTSFIANGETLIASRAWNIRAKAGIDFIDLTCALEQYPQHPFQATATTRVLDLDKPNLDNQTTTAIYMAMAAEYARYEDKKQRIELCPYINALQIKYAYAVTGHKAQGGQWKNVFIDPERFYRHSYDTNDLRWLYTAISRASENLYLIEPPASMLRI